MNCVDSLRNYSCGGGGAQYGGTPLPAAGPPGAGPESPAVHCVRYSLQCTPAGSTAGPAAAAPWLLILPALHILRVHILKHRHRQHLGALGLEGQPAGGLFAGADPDVSDDCCSTPVFYLRPRSVKVPWGRFTKEGALPTSHCSNISVLLYCCTAVSLYCNMAFSIGFTVML